MTEIRNQHGKVFDQAQLEPVLVTKQKRPSHVILSASTYEQLIKKLEELGHDNILSVDYRNFSTYRCKNKKRFNNLFLQ